MAKTLISTHTASASATLDITTGIDNTYSVYEFHCVNMHPADDGGGFRFQVNADGETAFAEYIISTMFVATHTESDSALLAYSTAHQALGTDYPLLNFNTGADNDQSSSGILTLYDPSSTTFVKHFVATGVNSSHDDQLHNHYVAGYINTAEAITEIRFKFHFDNIDAGVIKMYGVS